MAYQEVTGNLFDSHANCLINTINCVGAMGKGIALAFKHRFPDMFDQYRDLCRQNSIRPGEIWPFKFEPISVAADGQVERWRWIFNCAVKDHWRQAAKLEWIESCLRKFCENYERFQIQSAAFPWMGGPEWLAAV